MGSIEPRIDIIRSPEFAFWTEMFKDTMKVAKRIPRVTDSYIRRKADGQRALMKMEQSRIRELLDHEGFNANSIKKLPASDSRRIEYMRLFKRMHGFKNEYEKFLEILYARLYLKMSPGPLDQFVEVADPTQVLRRREQMLRQFPD